MASNSRSRHAESSCGHETQIGRSVVTLTNQRTAEKNFELSETAEQQNDAFEKREHLKGRFIAILESSRSDEQEMKKTQVSPSK